MTPGDEVAPRDPGSIVEATLRVLDGKWKGVILYVLLEGPARFSELHRRAASVSHRTLTNQLRRLEADGLLRREVFAEVPPRVVYSLSPRGRALQPAFAALQAWGEANVDTCVGIRATHGAPS